jgi:AcrR family transcriptional regulator
MRKLTDDKVRHILLLSSRGLGQAEIAKIVGVGVGTVNNYLKSKGTAQPAPPPAPPSEPAPVEVPDSIPEGIDLGTVDKWLRNIEEAASEAKAAKDFNAMSSLMAKFTALLEHRRKATPPAPPDPNLNPDFVEAARRARERLHKLIDTAVEK